MGPSWQGLYGSERTLESGQTAVADEDYLRRAILDPHSELVQGYAAVMPNNFEEQFAQEEEKYGGEVVIVEDIIAFIRALEE